MGSKYSGEEMRRVFAYYYYGRPVEKKDYAILDVLSRGGMYLQYYVEDGKLCAKAGRTGVLMKPVFE